MDVGANIVGPDSPGWKHQLTLTGRKRHAARTRLANRSTVGSGRCPCLRSITSTLLFDCKSTGTGVVIVVQSGTTGLVCAVATGCNGAHRTNVGDAQLRPTEIP